MPGEPLRVTLVTGSFPPDHCGVGDYSARLAEALGEMGVHVDVLHGGQWNLRRLPALIRDLDRLRPDLVHIQYPTIGYGRGLAPQGLAGLIRKWPVVTTIHEFSQSHALRQLALLPFSHGAGLVFTTDQERCAYQIRCRRIRGIIATIPIGSNVPFHPSLVRDEKHVVFFGLIRPNRGIEDVLDLARIVKDQGLGLSIEIIGNDDIRYLDYSKQLQQTARSMNVQWTPGLSLEQVGARLGRARFAYLPYPDGASPRRGSLLAALGNGAVVLTTVGAQTTPDMRTAIAQVASPAGAALRLKSLLASPAETAELVRRSMSVASAFSWSNIAERHVELYGRLTHAPQRRRAARA